MTRLDAFRQLEHHAWLGRVFRRITADDLRFCERYITEHAAEDASVFEAGVQRIFLDSVKPKHALHIMELLTCANSAAYAAAKEEK